MRASDSAIFFDCRQTAAWTKPFPPDDERELELVELIDLYDRALAKAAFKVLGKAHLASYARKLAPSSYQFVAAFRTKHTCHSRKSYNGEVVQQQVSLRCLCWELAFGL